MTQNLEPGAPVSEGWSPEGSDVVCPAERTGYCDPEVDKLIDQQSAARYGVIGGVSQGGN